MIKVANPVRCADCPLPGCTGLRAHEPEEIPVIQAFKQGEIALARGQMLIEQNITRGGMFTVLHGVLMRYRALDDGRRQVVNFMFPGDLIGLQTSFGDVATHSVEALLPSRLCMFDSGDFLSLITQRPSLGYDMTWLAAKEESALEEHLVALGRRSAKERVAYLAIWLILRARSTCTSEGRNRLAVTITQAQVADMLGLSLVHTNRTMTALARDGQVVWRHGLIEVPDIAATAEFAKFDMSRERARPFL